jgi:hypothetical protein
LPGGAGHQAKKISDNRKSAGQEDFMQNIFIAIGGSGAMVAEALIRLLAIGFPTRNDGGIFTSAGDSLQIWRVDPDRTSGAAVALQNCVDAYKELQEYLGTVTGDIAQSRWAMDLDVKIRHLDPLQLELPDDKNSGSKKFDATTLRDILDSKNRGKKDSSPFLDIFYEHKDLEVSVDRGFYQKPFIGAAIMAIFADTLNDGNSPGGSQAQINVLEGKHVRFFLCGSLHGGTGASGMPVLSKFLHDRKLAKQLDNWEIGGCLMAPYCVPPQPPFKSLTNTQEVAPDTIEQYLKQYGDMPAFSGLNVEDKRELIRQVLLGFYADPEEMQARARQGLVYYKDHSSAYFDQLYLVGKPEPDELRVWSNGGKSQRNPLNSAEVVGALAALNFFSGTKVSDDSSYVIPTSTEALNSQKMHLYDLPRYTVAGTRIDPERAFLATAVLRHLLIHQIRWDLEAKRLTGIEGLRKFYMSNEQRKEEDSLLYSKAAKLLVNFMVSLVDSRETIGWDEEDAIHLRKLLSDQQNVLDEITAKLSKKGWLGKEAREPLSLGNSTIKVSTIEFGEWCPPGETFTRGEYLRLVWSNLLTKEK